MFSIKFWTVFATIAVSISLNEVSSYLPLTHSPYHRPFRCIGSNEVFDECANHERSCLSIVEYFESRISCVPGCRCAAGYARRYFMYVFLMKGDCIKQEDCNNQFEIVGENDIRVPELEAGPKSSTGSFTYNDNPIAMNPVDDQSTSSRSQNDVDDTTEVVSETTPEFTTEVDGANYTVTTTKSVENDFTTNQPQHDMDDVTSEMTAEFTTETDETTYSVNTEQSTPNTSSRDQVQNDVDDNTTVATEATYEFTTEV